MSSFSGVFQIDMSSSFALPMSPPSQPASPLRIRIPAQRQQTHTPTFRVRYDAAPARSSSPSRPSRPLSNPNAPALLPVSDARTRRWVTAHALVSPAPNPSTYSYTVDEEKSVFSDDSDLESVSEASSDEEDSVESASDSSSESDDGDESAIFMTRNPSHLRLRSTNPSTASSRPPSVPRGRAAARRVTKGLRPITPPSAAPVILDYSRARGLSSSVASKQDAHARPQQHPRSSPSLSSLVAPSLTTDDSDAYTTPSVSESIPIPSALSRGRCRPSRIPPPDDDSEDERWWMPSPPDAARKERERATACGGFWDGWMKTANYA